VREAPNKAYVLMKLVRSYAVVQCQRCGKGMELMLSLMEQGHGRGAEGGSGCGWLLGVGGSEQTCKLMREAPSKAYALTK
jgi:hypothetical protein